MSWTFPFFAVSLLVRAVGSYVNIIEDCDETYNYWEPVHLLLYGSGFQTWEYSPEFALRSYWYPGVLYVLTAPLVGRVAKLSLFFVIRGILALFCSACEAFFFSSAIQWYRGPAKREFALVLGVSLTVLPGMFAASTALLPNSLSMCLYMLAFGAWLRNQGSLAVVCGALSALLGVPFSVVLLAPMAVAALLTYGVVRTFKWAVVGGTVALLPQVVIDYMLYGRLTVPVYNIVAYNALSSTTDSTLYGVEPASFYLKNLALNLNLLLPLSLLALPLAVVGSRRGAITILSPFVWLALMLWLPHKEQRFLYPIYPLLIFNGAFALAHVVFRWRSLRPLVWLLLSVVLVLSASRIAAQNVNRAAPMHIWQRFQHEPATVNRSICLGMDWYRFPSSFWLPHDALRVNFVPSDFHGLLPKPFAPWPDATSRVPTGMNALNREEPDRFVDPATCDFFVTEEPMPPKAGLTLDTTLDMVDDAKTSMLYRAFAIPYPRHKTHLKPYHVYRVDR